MPRNFFYNLMPKHAAMVQAHANDGTNAGHGLDATEITGVVNGHALAGGYELALADTAPHLMKFTTPIRVLRVTAKAQDVFVATTSASVTGAGTGHVGGPQGTDIQGNVSPFAAGDRMIVLAGTTQEFPWGQDEVYVQAGTSGATAYLTGLV